MKQFLLLFLFIIATLNAQLQNKNIIEQKSTLILTSQNSYSGTYYNNITLGATGEQLRLELYNLIKGHIQFPYSSSSTDTWDIVKAADQDPNNSNNVLLIYKGISEDKDFNQGVVDSDDPNASDAWNREHIWPKSRGGLETSTGAGTDVHNLKPSDNTVNTSRGNKDFDESETQHSEATECYYDSDSWEPRDETKGDIARMLFYMDVRYEGENGEPELHLVNYTANATGEPVIGKLSTLLQWHNDDPVDAFELNRNDIIYSYQQNRNPFIDHPEWVDSIWGSSAAVNPPVVVSVERDLKVPDTNQNLAITAVVTDNGSVSTVTLKYQLDENPEQTLLMTLTGVDTYTATISESDYGDGNLLKYYIVAEDDEDNLDYGLTYELFTGVTSISELHSVTTGGVLTYKGIYAKVKGVATVASHIFSNSSLDVVIQDADAGITIYKGGANSISIIEGREYTVCGKIKQYNGKAELVPDNPSIDIIDLGTSLIPKPIVLSLNQLLATPENYEGLLVTILQGANTGNGQSWPSSNKNANMEISDNGGTSVLTLRVDKDTDLDNNSEPSWAKDITGIFGQYDNYYPFTSGYQIQPRKYTDFSNSVLVQIKMFLQGAYNSNVGVNEMFTSLNNNVPLKSPYLEDPRKIVSIPPNIVDWVLVELRTTLDGQAVSSHSALLHKNGNIVADDGITSSIRITAEPNKNYFITVKHRNHLSVMSRNKVFLE